MFLVHVSIPSLKSISRVLTVHNWLSRKRSRAAQLCLVLHEEIVEQNQLIERQMLRVSCCSCVEKKMRSVGGRVRGREVPKVLGTGNRL